MTLVNLPLAITMGEPAGIGGEITLKAWLNRDARPISPFFIIDDPDRIARLAERLDWEVSLRSIAGPEEATEAFLSGVLPILPLSVSASATPGQPDPANCDAVIESIRVAVDLVQAGRAGAIVTNPIQKKTLYDAGFSHPGHTEYLAQLAGTSEPPIMMLACDELRVVPVTIHGSLSQAIEQLSTVRIIDTASRTVAALTRDFGIRIPHITIAALNPHAGEEGTMGREEIEIIRPAVDELKRVGIVANGPLPADTLFHERARETYDAVICMYHDQALIPLKTINFSTGVNITIGLPFVRTSPDHGTALEIAGTGVADESSLVAALRMAATMATNRTTAEIEVHERRAGRPA